MSKIELPETLTKESVKKYLNESFGFCGCVELEPCIDEIKSFLTWIESDKKKPYKDVFNSSGVYYLIAQKFDDLWLIEHGTSIRCPWLTSEGKRLLKFLNENQAGEIEESE